MASYPFVALQLHDSSGDPLAGGKLYFYESGSVTTPRATYTDAALAVPNVNPVILDSAGRATIFLGAVGAYNVVCHNAADVPQWSRDNISDTSLLIAQTAPRLPIADHYATVASVTTGETDLYSDTIAAGQLAVNGDKLRAQYAGKFIAHATATRTVRLYFGGVAIFTTQALTTTGTLWSWVFDVTIMRDTVNHVIFSGSFRWSDLGVTGSSTVLVTTATITLTNTNILKITGQAGGVGAASGDITAVTGDITFIGHA